jgi:hypothetical protein
MSSGGQTAQGGVAGTSTSGDAGTVGKPGPGAGGADAELGGAGGANDAGAAGSGGDGPIDACPNDPSKLAPGQCGCGVPESCAALKAALVHRYSFNQDGMTAVDSIGGKNGTIVGGSASQGKVSFDGTTATYVDLPNGMISALKDASFEVWL